MYFKVVTIPPPAATLIAPTGAITDNPPTYQWNAVANAAKYYLKVKDGSGTVKIGKWYTAAQAGCAGGTGICAVTPATALANGAGQWWIRTGNAAGNGPWSAPLAFTLSSAE